MWCVLCDDKSDGSKMQCNLIHFWQVECWGYEKYKQKYSLSLLKSDLNDWKPKHGLTNNRNDQVESEIVAETLTRISFKKEQT